MADPNEVTNWTILGVAGGGSLIYLLRWVVRTFHLDRTANAATDAEGGIISRLTAEITRLEEIIQRLTTRIDELENRIDVINANEIRDAGDLATLAVLVEAHCGKCEKVDGAKDRMTSIIKGLQERNSQ